MATEFDPHPMSLAQHQTPEGQVDYGEREAVFHGIQRFWRVGAVLATLVIAFVVYLML